MPHHQVDDGTKDELAQTGKIAFSGMLTANVSSSGAGTSGSGSGAAERERSSINEHEQGSEELARTGKIALNAGVFGCSSVTPTPGLDMSLPQDYAITPALHSGEPSGDAIMGGCYNYNYNGSGSFNNTNGTTKELL